MIHTTNQRGLLSELANHPSTQAWEAIVDRHALSMLHAARTVVRNADDANDVLHEAFLHVREKAAMFIPQGEVTTISEQERRWLQRLVVNVALNWQRARARRRWRERTGIDETRFVSPSPPSLSAPCEASEESTALHQALLASLAALSPRQRQTIIMHHLQGLDHAAIAEELGGTVPASRMCLYRALQSLRGQLRRRGFSHAEEVTVAGLGELGVALAQVPPASLGAASLPAMKAIFAAKTLPLLSSATVLASTGIPSALLPILTVLVILVVAVASVVIPVHVQAARMVPADRVAVSSGMPSGSPLSVPQPSGSHPPAQAVPDASQPEVDPYPLAIRLRSCRLPNPQPLRWEQNWDDAATKARQASEPILVIMDSTLNRSDELDRVMGNRLLRHFLTGCVLVRLTFSPQLPADVRHMGYTMICICDANGKRRSRIGDLSIHTICRRLIETLPAFGQPLPPELQQLRATYIQDPAGAIDLAGTALASGSPEEAQRILDPLERDLLYDRPLVLVRCLLPTGVQPREVLLRSFGVWHVLPDTGVAQIFADTVVMAPACEQELIDTKAALGVRKTCCQLLEIKRMAPGRRASLTGQLSMPDGVPAGGAFVSLEGWGQVKADPDGRYRCDNIAPGRYSLRAAAAGAEAEQDLDIAPGQARQQAMTLLPTRTYHIRWVQQTIPGEGSFIDGRPVAGEAILGERSTRFSLFFACPVSGSSDFIIIDLPGHGPVVRQVDGGGGSWLEATPVPFEKITSTATPWEPNMDFIPASAGLTFVLRSPGEDHVAKVELIDIAAPFARSF